MLPTPDRQAMQDMVDHAKEGVTLAHGRTRADLDADRHFPLEFVPSAADARRQRNRLVLPPYLHDEAVGAFRSLSRQRDEKPDLDEVSLGSRRKIRLATQGRRLTRRNRFRPSVLIRSTVAASKGRRRPRSRSRTPMATADRSSSTRAW